MMYEMVEDVSWRQKMSFEKLTIKDDVQLGIYEDAIQFALDNDDIKNVAISGIYGAGKSSIVASYEKKHADKAYLHISLAHFADKERQESGELNLQENNIKGCLEGKIINQLLHQIDEANIPYTNFLFKRDINNLSWFQILMIVVYFLFLLFAYFNEYIVTALCMYFFTGYVEEVQLAFNVLMLCCGILLLVFGIYKTNRWQQGRIICKKFSMKGAEIEIFNNTEASYFDRYLDDVLYLFDKSGADVIVFEDIDRFNDVMIFERLREINILVNAKRKNRCDKALKFFYLIRDDLFVNKDRTKFFDYIIPVIPVVDGSNTYPVMEKMFGNCIGDIDSKFLKGLAVFIDDMRLLKNIYNEYVIYSNIMNTTELSCMKMLAMITYKNVFPRDFSELHLDRGYVYNVFKNKKEIIKEKVCDLETQIHKIQNDLRESEKELVQNKYELAMMFAGMCSMNFDYYNNTYEKKIKYVENNLPEKDLNEYRRRLRCVEIKSNKERLIAQQKALENEKRDIWESSLSVLITESNREAVFNIELNNGENVKETFQDVKVNHYFGLLKYLIINGYVDEGYADYMTYFYPGSLNREDKNFLLSVASGQYKDFDYRLHNVGEILSTLNDADYDRLGTLNFDLFAALLENADYSLQRDRLIYQIIEKTEFNFIAGFVEQKEGYFVRALCSICSLWKDNFNILLSKNDMSKGFVYRWAIGIVENMSGDSLKAINESGRLTEYVASCQNPINVDKEHIEVFVNNMIDLDIKLENISSYIKNDLLFAKIIEYNMYQLNMLNINHILFEKYGEDNDGLTGKNYTIIRKHADETMYKYVHENFSHYVGVWLYDVEEIYDSADASVELLNNEALEDNHKIAYISKLRNNIPHLANITDANLWDILMSANRLDNREQNIIRYFDWKGLTDVLVKYINANNDLSFEEVECNNEVKDKFMREMSCCADIEGDNYERILMTWGYSFDNFDIIDVDDEKMSILIECKRISMNSDNLQFIREHYDEHLMDFIAYCFNAYVSIADTDEAEMEQILETLADKVPSDAVVKLLQKVQFPITMSGNWYNEKICMEIIKNHFCEDDLQWLAEKYEACSKELEDLIRTKMQEYSSMIVCGELKISGLLIRDLLVDTNSHNDVVIFLLKQAIANEREDVIKQYLKLTKYNNFATIFDTDSRPRFDVNENSKTLLECFKKSGYIRKFSESTDGKKYYISR